MPESPFYQQSPARLLESGGPVGGCERERELLFACCFTCPFLSANIRRLQRNNRGRAAAFPRGSPSLGHGHTTTPPHTPTPSSSIHRLPPVSSQKTRGKGLGQRRRATCGARKWWAGVMVLLLLEAGRLTASPGFPGPVCLRWL